MLGRRTELTPHKHAPKCRDHRRALPDGVRDSRPDKVNPRGCKVQGCSCHPNRSPKHSCKMPARRGRQVLVKVHWCLTINRLFHEERVHQKRAKSGPDHKEEPGSIGSGCIGQRHCLADKWVKASHQDFYCTRSSIVHPRTQHPTIKVDYSDSNGVGYATPDFVDSDPERTPVVAGNGKWLLYDIRKIDINRSTLLTTCHSSN